VTVAALYVETGGVYYGLPDVDPWDEERDARLYAGPWPVVAHPPCQRWSVPLAYVNQTRYGYKVGADGGCFAAALESVRRFGGVLEHPRDSIAWDRFGLPKPTRGVWKQSLLDGGWVTVVDQHAYGHPATKRTWLYAHGVDLPELDWTPTPDGAGATVSWLRGAAWHRATGRRPITRSEASATPLAFRDVLLDMARSASPALHRLDGCT
jgi:hypothetical protein